ncbi:hypothetical protein [Amycolatopsis magusensis]|uniref:Secreted protein n=1 Tax=Amycolatopsis magusensis TaxID=882444 RepID=A0ABS4PLK6_9PSEU|nr:hypothetical protein [Amycolatopsis magusensis]MBP2179723.1 hypothetical protein [Amycolatopsis magusensis]MDI5980946.1 hypothetical protein [Amycolatopsis magusensis]
MLRKIRALLLGAVAVMGLVVVSAPAAQAASYTAVAQQSGYSRTVILWRNNDNQCFHAEGRNLLRGETVSVVKNESEVLTATSPADGSTVSTGSFCSRGSYYFGALDLRAPDVFVKTNAYWT